MIFPFKHFLKYFLPLLLKNHSGKQLRTAQMKKSALPERRDCRDFALFCCSDRDFFANWWWPISAAFTPFCKINFILCKKKYRVSSFFAHRDRVTAEKKFDRVGTFQAVGTFEKNFAQPLHAIKVFSLKNQTKREQQRVIDVRNCARRHEEHWPKPTITVSWRATRRQALLKPEVLFKLVTCSS